MILFRSLLFMIFFILNTLLIAGTGVLVGWLLPPMQRFLFDNAWSRLNLWGLKVICRLDYRLQGMENLPQGNAIILSKHQSTWETIALISLIPYPKAWVIKRELLYVPVFGWVMYLFKPIAIDRKSGRKAVRQVIEQGLADGLWVIIFPEGTRVAPGEHRRYGIGGALLAEQSGYPVVPIAHNAGVFWRRRGLLKYPGTIDVRIGPVIDPKGLKASEINQRVEQWIETTQASLPQKQ